MIFVVAALIVAIGIIAYYYVQNHGFSSMIWKEVEEMAEGSPVRPERVTDPASLPRAMRRYLAYAIPDAASREVRSAAEHPAAEHPATEHPATEHPATEHPAAEHPAAEHPGAEHPAAEHPAAGFVRLRHGGGFRLRPGADWLSIRGAEYLLASAPAFVWTATVKQNPLLWIRARDRYIGHEGRMLVRLRGAVPVVDAAGPETDVSSLLRYLSEMPWFPTGFLTVPGLSWKDIDAHTAEATLTDGQNSVRGRFTVDDSGAMTAFTTEERFRAVDGTQVRTPWKGRYADYRKVDGLRIPHLVEAEWDLPEGAFTYVRFAVEEIQYDVPAPF